MCDGVYCGPLYRVAQGKSHYRSATLFTTFSVIRATHLTGAYEIVQVKQAPPNNNGVMDNQSQHLNPQHGIQFQMVTSKLLKWNYY